MQQTANTEVMTSGATSDDNIQNEKEQTDNESDDNTIVEFE